MGPTPPRSVILGVGGGIAAYKAVSLLRLFTESGDSVRVVPTRAALRFVGEPTWSALSGNPVVDDVWTDAHEVPHVQLGRSADLVVVAPATADLMARAAHGLADDLLTNVLLTATCPVVFAPAMHTEMWEHPATVANVALLRARGATVIDPDDGRLAGDDTGRGRLPEPAAIHEMCMARLAQASGSMAGRRVVVSAGGTREAIDPVRFLGNASSGRQGVALARAAGAEGAHVVLVAAHVDVELPHPVPGLMDVHRVSTAAELAEAMATLAPGADAVVMAAAVADFRPVDVHPVKIKKTGAEPEPLRLVRTVDVLASLSETATDGCVVVGFAAETGDDDADVVEHGRRKLIRKGCDLLVVNDVSGGRVFGAERNEVTILRRTGSTVEVVAHVAETDKSSVAHAVWGAVSAVWSGDATLRAGMRI